MATAEQRVAHRFIKTPLGHFLMVAWTKHQRNKDYPRLARIDLLDCVQSGTEQVFDCAIPLWFRTEDAVSGSLPPQGVASVVEFDAVIWPLRCGKWHMDSSSYCWVISAMVLQWQAPYNEPWRAPD
jgi:hypothetical protein